MNEFVSLLAEQFALFVRYRKACMRWNDSSYGANLKIFDKYCFNNFPRESVLTQEMVNSWCRQRETESNNSCVSRIYVIVSLVKFLRERNLTDISTPPIPAASKRTYIPHHFTNEELRLFFDACDNYKPYAPNNTWQMNIKYTLPIFFRLLYSTGLRTTEARLLRKTDVDLTTGVINIVNTKGYVQHFAVMHDSMTALMAEYDTVIETLYPGRMYFFPNGKTGFKSRGWVRVQFHNMWKQVSDSPATAYELRHHYAIENINKLVNSGMSFKDSLTYLSKSMGHVLVDITAKYYYSLAPVMADIIQEQSESGFNELIPEVQF